jgi:hypothetical protein
VTVAFKEVRDALGAYGEAGSTLQSGEAGARRWCALPNHAHPLQRRPVEPSST